MCYNVSTLTLNKLKYAKRIGASTEDVERLEREYERLKEEYGPTYFQSSFAFPTVPIHRNIDPQHPVPAQFSLIPAYATSLKQANTDRSRYRTANVKIETIHEKRLYKKLVKSQWCVVVMDGFFEYHHAHKKAHPFFIRHQGHDPLIMIGLWDEWMDRESGEVITSCNIMTRSAQGFMKTLHNNPKLTAARMPLILRPGIETEVLNDINLVIDRYDQLGLDLDQLTYHPVGKLVGKESIGNHPAAHQVHDYPALVNNEIITANNSLLF